LVGIDDGSVSDSFWDSDLLLGFYAGGGSGTPLNVTGLTTAQTMQLAATTAALGATGLITDTGGTTGMTWRIYEGQTTPLLMSFLKQATLTANDATVTYNGVGYSGGNGVTPSVAAVGGGPLLGGAYGGTAQGAVNVQAGGFVISASGFYSDQLGYDIIGYTDGTLTIDQLAITGAAIAAGSSTYASALTPGAVSFGNIVNGDLVTSTATVNTTTLSSSSNPIVGSYTQTAGAIGGTDAANYSFAGFTSAANYNITPAVLTVGAAGVNRVYDGTPNAAVTLTDNRITGDVFTTAYGTAAFLDKNVGTNKTVNVGGINVTGTDAGNYTFNGTATTTANITQLASVNWIGGSGNAWATAANWAGGALPDGMNVAAVVIPSGATVEYDSSVGSTTLSTLTNDGSLTIADGSLLTVLSSMSNTSNFTLNVAGTLSTGTATNTGTINIANGTSPTLNASSLNNQGTINIGDVNSTLSVSGTLNNQVAINSVGTTGSRTLNAGTLLNSGTITMSYPMTVAGVSYAAGTTLSKTTSAPPEYEQIARDITNIALNTDMDTSKVDGLTDEERKKKAEQALDDGETAVAEAGGQLDHLPVCQ